MKILFTCSVRDAFRGQLRVRIGGRGDIRGGRFVIVRPCPAVGGRDGEKEPDTFYRGPQLWLAPGGGVAFAATAIRAGSSPRQNRPAEQMVARGPPLSPLSLSKRSRGTALLQPPPSLPLAGQRDRLGMRWRERRSWRRVAWDYANEKWPSGYRENFGVGWLSAFCDICDRGYTRQDHYRGGGRCSFFNAETASTRWAPEAHAVSRDFSAGGGAVKKRMERIIYFSFLSFFFFTRSFLSWNFINLKGRE